MSFKKGAWRVSASWEWYSWRRRGTLFFALSSTLLKRTPDRPSLRSLVLWAWSLLPTPPRYEQNVFCSFNPHQSLCSISEKLSLQTLIAPARVNFLFRIVNPHVSFLAHHDAPDLGDGISGVMQWGCSQFGAPVWHYLGASGTWNLVSLPLEALAPAQRC